MKIPEDKLKHLTYSMCMAAYLGFISRWAFGTVLWGYLAALAIGGLKELIYDKIMGRGQAEWIDMVFNIIGIAIAASIYILLCFIFL